MIVRLLCFLIMVAGISGVRAQTALRGADLIISPGDTVRLDTITGCDNESILLQSLHNPTTDTLHLSWIVIYNTFPHGWSIGYCDPTLCRSPIPTGRTYQFKLAPNATGLMQLDLTPASGTACGNFQVFIWATNDSANTATYLNYQACITTGNCANGIAEAAINQISLYPNPVKGSMRITLPQTLANGRVDIYSLIGSKVYSETLNTSKDIDLSMLESGLYIARISDGGKVIATKKFTKAE